FVARGHGVGMPGSQDALAVGQRAPVQPGRLTGLALGSQRGGEFLPRAERFEVVSPADAPAATRACPRLRRAAMVPGWSGPAPRIRAVSTHSNQGRASATRPAVR